MNASARRRMAGNPTAAGSRKFWFAALWSAALIVAAPAAMATVQSAPVTITRYVTFSDFGGGDVVIVPSSATAGCADGFWLRPADPGFKSLYATLMMAYATRSTVTIAGYTDSVWTGSSGTFCRVYAITPE